MSQLGSEDLIESDDYSGAAAHVRPPSELSASGSAVKVTATGPEPPGPFVPLAPSSSSSAKGKKRVVVIEKDKEYFMESAFVVFEVEECLFRVPSYLFAKESHVFGGMFQLPQPQDDGTVDPEGSSESNPIRLAGVAKEDFRCVLKALYPLSFTLRLLLSKAEWLSILKFSTKYYFLTLRQTAINELNRTDFHLFLTCLERINYGRKYYVSDWIISGLVDLVLRDQSINDDEGLDIDSDYPTTAYKLFRTREHRLRGFATGRPSVTKEIEGLFKDELDRVRADEKEFDRFKVDEEIPFPGPEKAKENPFVGLDKAKENTEKQWGGSWGSDEKKVDPEVPVRDYDMCGGEQLQAASSPAPRSEKSKKHKR